MGSASADNIRQLVANGTLRAHFNAQQKMELLEFITTNNEEYISRKQVIEAAKPAHTWIKDWRNVNSDAKQSPEMTKKGKGKQLKSPQSHPPDVLMGLPDSAVSSKGVTPAAFQFLEVRSRRRQNRRHDMLIRSTDR